MAHNIIKFILLTSLAFAGINTYAQTQPVQELRVSLGVLTFDGAEPNAVFGAAYQRKLSPKFDLEGSLSYYTSSNVSEGAKNRPLINPALSLSDFEVWGTYLRTLVFADFVLGYRPFEDGFRLVAGISFRHLAQVSVTEVWNRLYLTPDPSVPLEQVALWGNRYREQQNVGFVAGLEYGIELSEVVGFTLYAQHHNYGSTTRNSLTFSGGGILGVRW